MRPGRLPAVKRVIAIGSGKGGVGKSTVAANLALALRDGGLDVGLLDADIFGPSMPALLGIDDAPRRARMTENRQILPLEVHGLRLVSFGFFLGPGSPAIWRGPLVAKAVEQVSRGVVWPPLDLVVVDLPPGTGDVPLSLAGTIRVDGGIVVTTPQRLAVEEAEKALEMFRALEVPALGIVENMSFSRCACGRTSHPFGRGGGRELAERRDVPLLAELPFAEQVDAERGDERPPLLADPAGEPARRYRRLAAEVVRRLEEAATEEAATEEAGAPRETTASKGSAAPQTSAGTPEASGPGSAATRPLPVITGAEG